MRELELRIEFIFAILAIAFSIFVVVTYDADNGITGFATQSEPLNNELLQVVNDSNATQVVNDTAATPFIEVPADTALLEGGTANMAALSTCVTPYENMVITADTTFCPGTYYLNDPEGDGAIILDNSFNLVLDCNNAVFIGNHIVKSHGLHIDGLYQNNPQVINVTVKNCNFLNYDNGILSVSTRYLTIVNTSFINSSNVSAYFGAFYHLTLDGVNSSYSGVSHGLYLDTLFNQTKYPYAGKNAIIRNSVFSNNKKYGIHINGNNADPTRNIEIYNSQIYNNAQTGIDDMSCNDCKIHDNYIHDNKDYGIQLHDNVVTTWVYSKNTQVYSNTIYGNANGDIRVMPSTTNDTIYLNTYVSKNPVFYLDAGDYSVNINEKADSLLLRLNSFYTWIKFTYTGTYVASLNNGTVHIYDQAQQFPYNDIKDASTGQILASNVDNFSITLQPNQQILVGNFVNKTSPVNTTTTNTPPTLSITSISTDNSSVQCAFDIADNGTMNVTVDWYRNGVHAGIDSYLNRLSQTIVSTTPSAYGDDVSCNISVTDGQYVTNDTRSIKVPNAPIVHQAIVSLVSPIDNYTTTNTNMTLSWDVVGTDLYYACYLYTDSNVEIISTRNNTITSKNLISSLGTHSWAVNCSGNQATRTYTIASPTSPPPAPTGGGGGSGGTVTTNTTTNTTNTTSPVFIPPGQRKQNTTKSTKNRAVEEFSFEETPTASTIEQPSPIVSHTTSRWPVYIIATLVFALLAALIIKNSKAYKTDQRVTKYILSALYAGYSYAAIRKALNRKGYSQALIDEYFYMLRLRDARPLVRVARPVNKAARPEMVASLREYVRAQQAAGFDKNDIKEVLLHYGHPKATVLEALKK